MKSLIIFICLQVFALTIFGQQDYLLLTKGKFHQRIKKIPEGSRVSIMPLVSEYGNLRGKLDILNDSCITVGGDSIYVKNIEKILVRNTTSNVIGGLAAGAGLVLAFGGTYVLSNITFYENPIFVIFQLVGCAILVGVIGTGIVYTVAGILILTKGFGYKTSGRRGYSISVSRYQNNIASGNILKVPRQKL